MHSGLAVPTAVAAAEWLYGTPPVVNAAHAKIVLEVELA
jgi:hypothetical protein